MMVFEAQLPVELEYMYMGLCFFLPSLTEVECFLEHSVEVSSVILVIYIFSLNQNLGYSQKSYLIHMFGDLLLS